MKKILIQFVVFCISCGGLNAFADGTLKYAGPFTVNLSVVQQVQEGVLVKSNLVKTATTTNQTLIYKSTTKKLPLNTATVLSLLGNSFNTTFPAGARLTTDGFLIYVTDKTGTNVIIPISSVLTVDFTDSVGTQRETEVSKTTKAGSSEGATVVGTELAYVNMVYDDSALATKDGTHSKFQCTGIFSAMYNRNTVTEKESETFQINEGAGSGTIRGVNSIILGGAMGKASGIVQPQ